MHTEQGARPFVHNDTPKGPNLSALALHRHTNTHQQCTHTYTQSPSCRPAAPGWPQKTTQRWLRYTHTHKSTHTHIHTHSLTKLPSCTTRLVTEDHTKIAEIHTHTHKSTHTNKHTHIQAHTHSYTLTKLPSCTTRLVTVDHTKTAEIHTQAHTHSYRHSPSCRLAPHGWPQRNA